MAGPVGLNREGERTMQLRQIVRAFRNSVWSGAPEIEFINLRTPRLRADTLLRGGAIVTLTYAAAMPINAALGNLFIVSPTDNVAFAFGVPSNPPAATLRQRITIQIVNATGAPLGAATFTAGAGGFRIGAAWTQPANGFSRSIDFDWDGVEWREVGRTAADVAN